MESVQAAPRRTNGVVCSLLRTLAIFVVVTMLGCPTEDRHGDDVPPDCSLVLRKPKPGRVMQIPFAVGAPTPLDLPPCEGVCVVSAGTTWLAKEGEVARLHIGERTLRLPFARESPIKQGNKMWGISIGHKIALVDRGETWDILGADCSTRTIPRPDVPASTWVTHPKIIGDGVFAKLMRGTTIDSIIPLIPPSTPPPEPGFVAVSGPDGVGAWVRLDDDGSTLIFPDGTRQRSRARYEPLLGADANRNAVILWGTGKRAVIVGKDGSEHALHGLRTPIVMTEELIIFFEEDRISTFTTPAHPTTRFTRAKGSDFAGRPLPHQAVVERVDVVKHRDKVLALERVRLQSCKLEDRLYLVDLSTWEVAALTQRDEKMRMHLGAAPGGFTYVEADAEYAFE